MLGGLAKFGKTWLLRHRLAWPLITLALLLIVNTVFNSSFLHIEWRDGHLYGSLIDILNRAAPLVLVSLGMTLVIATRGIDISVGATVAIAAAVAAWLIGGSVSGTESRFPLPVAILGAIGIVVAPIGYFLGFDWAIWFAVAAAAGLALTMVGAMWVHAARGEAKYTLKMNLQLLIVALLAAGLWAYLPMV